MTSPSQVDIRRKVLRDTDLIPPLPEVVVRILGMLNEGNHEPAELEEVMRCDPVLVARMLAMVNSPFFGMRCEVTSIKNAIMVLGYQNLRSMIMVTSTSKFMKQDFACYGHEDKGLWTHAVAVAAGAKTLAGDVGEDPVLREELFIGALLHDIGKMVLSQRLSRHAPESIDSFPCVAAAEAELLGITHAEAGTLVAAKWNLSPLVSVVVQKHHADEQDAEYERFVAIVRLADAFAHQCGTGYLPGRAPTPEYRPRDLEILDLDPAAWEEAQERMYEAVELALTHIAGVYG